MSYRLLMIIASLCFTVSLVAQTGSNGFTKKSEAKNKIVNGKKEGKWVEYFNIKHGVYLETEDKHADVYKLSVYKDGKSLGLVREYYHDGKLKSEIPYVNGKVNGTEKQYNESEKLVMEDDIANDGSGSGTIKLYYDNGKLKAVIPFVQDKLQSEGSIFYNHEQNSIHALYEGAIKTYYDNGKPESEIVYIDGKKDGIDKEYYENGRLKSQTLYINGQAEKTTNYDENGKEIK